MTRYDSAELITRVKRIASVPTNQSLFTTDGFLELANAELRLTLVPMLQSVVEEYFVVSEDFTVSPSSPQVTIPDVASGLRLREVFNLNTSDSTINTAIPRIQLETIGQFTQGVAITPYYGPWGAYYLMNNTVNFWPAPTQTFMVRLLYYRTPNLLVDTANGTTLTSIDYNTSIITVPAVPSTWSIGDKLDALIPSLPYNLRRKAITITNKTGTTITVSAADTVDLASGDYLYPEGDSGFIQYMPAECFDLLAQATAVKVLEALGDQQGLLAARASLAQMATGLMKVISPRTVGSPKKLSPQNTVFRSAKIGSLHWR